MRDIAAIEKALRAGHTARGQRPKGGKFGAIAVAALDLGIPYKTLDDRVRPNGLYERLGLAVDWDLAPSSSDGGVAARSRPQPPVAAPDADYFILTAAQNDTQVNLQFLDNLRTYAAHLGGARILCGKFSYQTDVASERARTEDKKGKREYKWDPELHEYLTTERTPIGSLLFCAEMNTLPTANRPLSGLHTYGQGRTAIFPHAKVALETVPLAHGDFPPIVLTTGCCTVPNYTDTKAGHKGEFHHIFGAVLVEVAADGFTAFRHIIAHNDGSFQDLDVILDANGALTTGNRVEALTYGDIHSPFLDPLCARANWGFDVESWGRDGLGLVDSLRPRYQFFHDLIDHAAISHHEEKNTLARFKRYLNDEYLVQKEIDQGAAFLRGTTRDFAQSVVVKSNHDRWLSKWLDRCDHRKDRPNALAYLRLEYARHKAVAEGDADFDVIHYALRNTPSGHLNDVVMLREGQGFQICQDTGGIECGDHFDLGPNGAKGTPTALARVSGKANGGDKHTAQIMDGLYIAGVSCLLRRGYNLAGPSSWRHANIVTYGNGKRSLIFLENGRYRA